VTPLPATPPPPLAAEPTSPPAEVAPSAPPVTAQPVEPNPDPSYGNPQVDAGGYSGQYPAGPPPPPPPPPRKADEGFEMPTISIRVDPFNWLINGRFGLELEAELVAFLSVELVPVFIVAESPPAFRLDFDDEVLTQHSNGLGALAGTSIGVGFWLSGKPLRGTVFRAIFTNYAITYRASDAAGVFDEVSHTERQFFGFLGSNATWGVFTLGGGIGLGVELNEEKRCFTDGELAQPTSDCQRDELQIALRREDDPPVADINSSLHPVQLMGRISLGVTF